MEHFPAAVVDVLGRHLLQYLDEHGLIPHVVKLISCWLMIVMGAVLLLYAIWGLIKLVPDPDRRRRAHTIIATGGDSGDARFALGFAPLGAFLMFSGILFLMLMGNPLRPETPQWNPPDGDRGIQFHVPRR